MYAVAAVLTPVACFSVFLFCPAPMMFLLNNQRLASAPRGFRLDPRFLDVKVPGS